MSLLDRTIAVVSPSWALDRARARMVLATYEATQPGRLRKLARDTRGGNALTQQHAIILRNQARHFDRNHDLARGMLDKLVDFIVGPTGVSIDPQPRLADGTLATELQAQLRGLWREWSEWPEVTWMHDWVASQQLACRTWLRDGECLSQLVSGTRADLQHGSRVPFSIELLEPDLLPYDLEREQPRIRQGIELNQWNRPVGYHLYRQHPGELDWLKMELGRETKRVPAESLCHIRYVDRIGALRGVSIFASAITRLDDLKDYEQSERIAAKLSAKFCFRVSGSGASSILSAQQAAGRLPEFRVEDGMAYVATSDNDQIEPINMNRPNSALMPFRDGQIRAASRGVGLGTSAATGDYNGSYSAKRQELVESWLHYRALTSIFVAQFVRPTYQRFTQAAEQAGLLTLPAGLNRMTLAHADYRGPVMPWIDPMKEINAVIESIRAGLSSSQQAVRDRGGQYDEVFTQLAQEQKKRDAEGVRAPALDAGIGEVATALATAPETSSTGAAE